MQRSCKASEMQNESPKNFHFHFRAAAYLREAEECKASEMQNESPKNFHFHFRAARPNVSNASSPGGDASPRMVTWSSTWRRKKKTNSTRARSTYVASLLTLSINRRWFCPMMLTRQRLVQRLSTAS